MAQQYPSAFQPPLSETEAAQTTRFSIEVPTTTVDGLVDGELDGGDPPSSLVTMRLATAPSRVLRHIVQSVRRKHLPAIRPSGPFFGKLRPGWCDSL